ncbi:hypothetical protein [Brevibacterium marinum]|uniref:Uncharacterized protein n=1 Tax=Brevibacterium marinum TaxID=418643 RepID=A0A846RPE7_9MICO|nr:hypothetical protein [Brevibacterium marinum]NJC55794.1 hypothetical protein [Brevibacterium marinum]
MAPSKSGKKSTSTVSYKDALKAGLVCGVVVLILAIIVTRAWQDGTAFGFAFLYAGVAFVAVSGVACILNWVMRNDTQNDDQTYPVLR